MIFFHSLITIFSTVDFVTALGDKEVYASIWWVVGLLSFFMVIAYYYIINDPRFTQTFHWIGWLILNSFFNFVWAFWRTRQVFTREGYEFGMSEYISFAVNVGVIAAILFFILSILLKNWSTNAKKTPF
ncbi:MAG: hypothetical protein KBF93_18305 [Leptospiraceae bacterium]|mgnify:CR=1 FL=1|nr:hypothetical protein [Leptospiraceae bacterium]